MNIRYDLLLNYSSAPLCGSFVLCTYLLPEACWSRFNNWLSGTKTPWCVAFANLCGLRLPRWPVSASQHNITKSRGGKRHIQRVLTRLPLLVLAPTACCPTRTSISRGRESVFSFFGIAPQGSAWAKANVYASTLRKVGHLTLSPMILCPFCSCQPHGEEDLLTGGGILRQSVGPILLVSWVLG